MPSPRQLRGLAAAVISLRCLPLGFAELWWMDVAAVGARDYLLIEEALVRRGGRGGAKRGGAGRYMGYGPTGPGPIWPTSGPSFSCALLVPSEPSTPLHVGFRRHYPRDQDKGSCRINSGLLSRSSGISCHCILVLATFGSRFILCLYMNGVP
jgi:hypothetical protein